MKVYNFYHLKEEKKVKSKIFLLISFTFFHDFTHNPQKTKQEKTLFCFESYFYFLISHRLLAIGAPNIPRVVIQMSDQMMDISVVHPILLLFILCIIIVLLYFYFIIFIILEKY